MAFNTGNAPGSTDPRDLEDSSGDIDAWATDRTKLSHPDRLGVQRLTWHGMEQRLNDILIAGGRIFDTEAQGRAAVDNGQYYFAVSTDPDASRTLWRRDSSTVSTKIANEVNKKYVDKAFTDISIHFEDEIVYDNLAGQITFPAGTALRTGGGVLLNFEAVTLEAPTAIPNGAASGLAYYYYLDFSETVDHPIKFATGGGAAFPLQNGSICKIGTLLRGDWNNSEFSFKSIDQPRSYRTFLKNVIPNANKDPRSDNVIFYGDIRPTSTDNSPLVDAPEPLTSLGIEKTVLIEGGGDLHGNFLVFPFSAKTTVTPNIFMAMAVHSPSGNWDFGAIGPYYYLAAENSIGAAFNVQQGELSVLREIDGNTRVYGLSLYPDEPPEGAQFARLTLGMRAVSEDDYYFGGFWTSIAGGVNDFLQGVGLDETYWPQWKQVDMPITDTPAIVKNTSGLKTLVDSTANPLHSMQVRLIGDSITWGTGATGNSPSTPRAQSLGDPRNNLTARTWANLLRDYLGNLYCGVLKNRTDLGDGGSVDSHLVAVQPINSSIRFIHPITGILFDPVITEQYPDGFAHGYAIDIRATGGVSYNYNCDIEIDLTGDNLKVVFSQLIGDAALNRVDVLVDGIYQESFAYNGESVSFGVKSPTITFPFGKHKITLRRANTALDNATFRLEGFEVEQKVILWNDGIIGSNTSRWMPPSGLIVDAIDDADEVVFVQLGTNNRSPASLNLAQKQFERQLISIVEYLLDLNKKVVLCASCVASIENESQTDEGVPVYAVHMNEIAATIKKVSEKYELDFIDQYAATLQPYTEGELILDDGLHPNDAGYKIMFDNIKQLLIGAI